MLHPKEIPSFVGRDEVARALGISTSTLQRIVNDGGFPRPTRLSPNHVGWSVSIVRSHLESRIQGVTQLAVTDPAKLKPDDVAEALQQLGAQHASALAGRPIAPEDIEGVTVRLSPEGTAQALESAKNSLLMAIATTLYRLPPAQAWIVVAGLMPQIGGPATRELEALSSGRRIESESQMMALALNVLDQALSGEFVDPAVRGSGVAGAATTDSKEPN